MKALMRTGIATLAASVGAGLVVVGVGAAQASNGSDDGSHHHQAFAKREDSAHEWVVVADDDDNGDDPNRLRAGDDHTRTGAAKAGSHTRTRGGTHTRTRSRHSHRDRDHSRGDRVRDWTHDGIGGKKRDFSANLTNDGSRHNTRGR